MGTWGTGPFASDTAQDYLDGLVVLSDAERSEAVGRMLAAVASEPSRIADEVMPEEVIAAAALVAESLLGGDSAPPWGTDDLADSARFEEPFESRDIENAVRALDIVADPGGWYMRSWSSEADTLLAQQALEQIRSVLSGR